MADNPIIRAAQFARGVHARQRRKYTGEPYIHHPARVAARVMLLPDATEAVVCAAWLHDVQEDCGIANDQIAAKFGAAAALYVNDLTNVAKWTHPNANRAERKSLDHARLFNTCAESQNIKCIDRIDNLNDMRWAPLDFARLYVMESEQLAEVLTKALPELRGELVGTIRTLAAGLR